MDTPSDSTTYNGTPSQAAIDAGLLKQHEHVLAKQSAMEADYRERQRQEQELGRRNTALAYAMQLGIRDTHAIVEAAEAFDAFLVGRPNAPVN
jgi:hypothetical protein